MTSFDTKMAILCWCAIKTHITHSLSNDYRKNSKIWDTSNNCHNCPKNRKVWCNIALMHPKDADGMANSVDPDQTASSEAVWSWSALFAETYLSQYIEFVRYLKNTGRIKPNFIWCLHVCGELVCEQSWSLTKMPIQPYMVKIFKSSSSNKWLMTW